MARPRWLVLLVIVLAAIVAGGDGCRYPARGQSAQGDRAAAPEAGQWGCLVQEGDGLYWINANCPPLRIVALKDYMGIEYCSASPDGRGIALVTSKASLVRELSTGTTVTLRTEDDRSGPVAWSPDGRTLAFVKNDSLRLLDPGGEKILLTGVDNIIAIAWSPDGSDIAYFRGYNDPQAGLWICPAEGGKPRRLSRCVKRPPDADLMWSPDGKWIAMRYPLELEHRPAFVRHDGTEYRELDLQSAGPDVWRRDGSALLFAGPSEFDEGITNLFSCEPSGRPCSVMATGPDTRAVAMLPDGLMLTAQHPMGAGGPVTVKLVATGEPGQPTRLSQVIDADYSITAALSPDGQTAALSVQFGDFRWAVWMADKGEKLTRRAVGDIGGSVSGVILGWMRPATTIVPDRSH